MASIAADAAVAPYAEYIARSVAEVAADLDRLVLLLNKWQPAQNLVSRETLSDVWTRHVVDSLQLLQHIPASAGLVVDLGSGGGFPALPLAIAAKGSSKRFTLVEPNQRKVAFLRTVIRELGLDAGIEPRRIEEIDSRETLPVDVITSRALASLAQLCNWSSSLFRSSTIALFHKGREYGEELREARVRWDFDVLVLPSDTSRDGVLLQISHLRAKTSA